MPGSKDKRRARRVTAQGRTEGATARFSMLPHRVLESAAYASLDLTGRCVLQELVMLFNHSNNGSLYMSVRDAAARLGLSDNKPVIRAFDDLQERSLIMLAKDAHFAVKASDTSRARCWRLAWHAWPECPVKAKRGPVWDFEQYQSEGGSKANKRATRRLKVLAKYRKDKSSGRLPVVDSTTTTAKSAQFGAAAVVDSSTAKAETDANPPFRVGGDSSTHIDNTMGSGVLAWWGTPSEAQILSCFLLLSIINRNRPFLRLAA